MYAECAASFFHFLNIVFGDVHLCRSCSFKAKKKYAILSKLLSEP